MAKFIDKRKEYERNIKGIYCCMADYLTDNNKKPNVLLCNKATKKLLIREALGENYTSEEQVMLLGMVIITSEDLEDNQFNVGYML